MTDRPFPNEREHREGGHWWRCAPITELRLAEERAHRCPDCGVAPGEGGHSWGCRIAVRNAEAAVSDAGLRKALTDHDPFAYRCNGPECVRYRAMAAEMERQDARLSAEEPQPRRDRPRGLGGDDSPLGSGEPPRRGE